MIFWKKYSIKKIIIWSLIIIFLLLLIVAPIYIYNRYATAKAMQIPIVEFSNFQYPDDPASRSIHYGQYSNRKLTLVQKDDRHFDFVLEPNNSHTAKIVFKDVDVSLMTPNEPAWTKSDKDIEKIALIDRQWNRQQVSFPASSEHIIVTGGDGFEKNNATSFELAKNCLNAGLWEILLFTTEDGKKVMYYHGWFTFPLGYYKKLFELNTGLSYSEYWYSLEHWKNPAGAYIDLNKLRQVKQELKAQVVDKQDEPIIIGGEQKNKQRIMNAENIFTWQDFVTLRDNVRFATFIPPGRYSVKHPWKNEFWRIAKLDGASLRDIISPADTSKIYQEIELDLKGTNGEPSKFIISGFDINKLPILDKSDYSKGLYMPMGIGIPPFNQSYADTEKNPAYLTPYFCLLLDNNNRWINHHDVAIDGIVMFRDKSSPNLIQLYLLSYERESLIRHYEITLDNLVSAQPLQVKQVMKSKPSIH